MRDAWMGERETQVLGGNSEGKRRERKKKGKKERMERKEEKGRGGSRPWPVVAGGGRRWPELAGKGGQSSKSKPIVGCKYSSF